MSETYTKLFGSIIHSTIWREDPYTKIVWVTMLAMSDQHGYVGASVPGLAAAAQVTIQQTEAALLKFMAPDKYSRSQEFEGRRIESADRGWNILNYDRFRDMRDEEIRKQYERDRKREQRAKMSRTKPGRPGVSRNVPRGPEVSAQAEADPEADQKQEELPSVGALPRSARDLIGPWCLAWKAKHGQNYRVTKPDAGAVDTLIKSWPGITLDEWHGMCANALASGRCDELRFLALSPNQWRSAKRSVGVVSTQDAQVAAGRRFLERHQGEQ